MTIHPLLVHFPIAFFTAYALFELISLGKIKKQPFWFYIKAILIILGVLGAGGAIITGNIIEDQFLDKARLVELHSTINKLATAVFFIVAFSYAIEFLRRSNFKISFLGIFWNWSLKFEKIVLETPVSKLLALIGLILIIIGGALGGAIAYGPDFDPFTHFIYSLFFR